MKHPYTVIYTPEYGGFSYEIRCRGRVVGSGWVLGKKRNAEDDARNEIAKLQAQKAAA